MSQQPEEGATAPPDIIYIIRHGEKPADPPSGAPGQTPPAPGPPFGVDVQGSQNPHSLLPRGWQRSGALIALFDPASGLLQGRRIPACRSGREPVFRRRAHLLGAQPHPVARLVAADRPCPETPPPSSSPDGQESSSWISAPLSGRMLKAQIRSTVISA
jgi:hypothetical protein